MNTTSFFSFLSTLSPLSDELKAAIERELAQLSFPKHHLLLEAPRVSEYIYFLNKGFAFSYVFIEGRKQVERFWQRGQLIISPDSFFDVKPSEEYIELMEISELLCLSREGMLRLSQGYPDAPALFLKCLNHHHAACRQYRKDLRWHGAAYRYTQLIAMYERLEQLATQDEIASYLGITPQSLSRLKRRNRRG